MNSLIKTVKNVTKSAVDATKEAVTYFTDKTTEVATALVNKTKEIARDTAQKTQEFISHPVQTTSRAAKEFSENWHSGINQLKQSGTAGQIFGSYSEGVVQQLNNTFTSTVQLVKDPLGTVSESVNFFLEDPLKNNPVTALGMYYYDVGKASYAHDWNTVANKVGSGTVTVAEVLGTEYVLKGINGLKKNPAAKNPAGKSSVANGVKESATSSSSGIRNQSRYSLTGAEHYEDLKHVFGADNVKWETSVGAISKITEIPEKLGIVQSRINIAKGQTRFTPLRPRSNKPVSAGFKHVSDGHFNVPLANNRSVFSISKEELKEILQSKQTVQSPVTPIEGGQYLRVVDTGKIVGKTSLNYGGVDTTWIKIFTDKAGNLITTYPVPGK